MRPTAMRTLLLLLLVGASTQIGAFFPTRGSCPIRRPFGAGSPPASPAASTTRSDTTTTTTKATASRSSSLWWSLAATEKDDVPQDDVDDGAVCTVQILMSDTGGGHRASANALRDAFDVLHPGRIRCDIVDIYTEYGPFWPFDDYPALYKIMAEYSFLWDWFYHFGATELGLALNEWMLETFCFDPFRLCLDRPSGGTSKRADMVVSVHPLCQDIPLKILAHLDTGGKSRDVALRRTPFATVVTDLAGAHPTWFNPGVDKCFVPTDVLYQCAIDRKLDPAQILQYGLPIRRGFWSTVSENDAGGDSPKGGILSRVFGGSGGDRRERADDDDADADANGDAKDVGELRARLGLDANLPTVLIVGGGDGMGGIVDIASSVGKKLGGASDASSSSSSSSPPKYQMVVVCGKNEAAKNELMTVEFGCGVKAIVEGFVSNMDEWMKASDVLITKAGPGTIAEASICGLPCMLFAFLPGQEAGNVPYVERNGFGKYSEDPIVIADTVRSWLASSETLRSMRKAALDAARPDATLDIARDLADMVFATKRKSNAVDDD